MNNRNKGFFEKISIMRDNVLREMEDGIIPNNETLVFLGLSHMLHKDEFNVSTFTQKLFNVSNEINHIKYDESDKTKHSLLPEQSKALHFLEEGHSNSILIAPTSFGKSLIVREYIHRNMKKHKTIAFILPSNALSLETEESLKYKTLLSNEYIIYDTEINDSQTPLPNEPRIFIGTQEKISLLKNTEFDLIILDEAYKMSGGKSNDKRTFLLNDVMQKYIESNDSKVIFLSPTCKFNDDRKIPIQKFTTRFSPVAMNYEQVNTNSLKKKADKFVNEKTIVFFDKIGQMRHCINIFKEIEIKNNFPEKALLYLRDTFTEDWLVNKAIEKGLLIHNGQIPKFMQEYAIRLFENDSNVLIGTTSIADGINTKAKNVIIKIDNKSNSEWFKKEKILIRNVIGRAGRMGEYHVGNIYGYHSKEEFYMDFIDDDSIEVNIESEESHNSAKPSFSEDIVEGITGETDIDLETVTKNLDELGLSKNYFNGLKTALENDYENSSYSNIVNMYKIIDNPSRAHFFSRYSNEVWRDGGAILSKIMTLDKDDKFIPLKERVGEWIASHEKNKVEVFIKNLYSIAPHEYLPICTKGMEMIDSGVVKPGKNAKEILINFKLRYANSIIGRENYDQLSEKEKNILNRLHEHGVPVDSRSLGDKELSLISDELKNRYSMFDIRNAIYKASKVSKQLLNIKETFFYFE